MWSTSDLEQMKKKGISPEQVESQLTNFRNGFPYLKIKTAATPLQGVIVTDESAQQTNIENWEMYQSSNPTIVKFVPASGAATRMFKNLFEFLEHGNQTATSSFEQTFFEQLPKFAFYKELQECVQLKSGKSIEELITNGQATEVVRLLLEKDGLNYANLPKGLLKFHNYADGNRTPVEEHLAEGAQYAANSRREVNIHFTVSTEHRELFQQLVDNVLSRYSKELEVVYNISYSEQKSSTDTLAVDMENKPFRENGKLLFRPAGHGALIENLNEIDADIVFIKNIDNVVPDRLKGETTRYKQILAGLLITIQQKVYQYLKRLEMGDCDPQELEAMAQFVEEELGIDSPAMKELKGDRLACYLYGKLNRPIRVCGMVRNVGEPGGGPFITRNSDGSFSLQILESSQINLENKKSRTKFEHSTHFNPVDLVCAVRDYKGEKFDLTKYVDPNTGFISYKSKSGRDLKAIELPGLWNGAMADWTTLFVEVPMETFNPVKTVNDLLRPEHQ